MILQHVNPTYLHRTKILNSSPDSKDNKVQEQVHYMKPSI